MPRKPGNPKNGRRLVGVPKAGPLYVNGIQVPKGNVQAAVSRMYRTSQTRLAEDGEPGSMQLRPANDCILEAGSRCAWCGQDASGAELLALDLDAGQWWHMRNDIGTLCRSLWLQQHTEATG